MNQMPWIPQQETDYYYGRQSYSRLVYKDYEGTCIKKIREYLPDNPAMTWRKGDIIKFNCGYHTFYPLPGWQGWFLKKRDRKRFYPRDKRVPVYAMSNYAVICGRYRIVRFKYRTFADYGCVVMMLSGPHVGHIRHYWVSYPFHVKICFPRQIKYKYLKKALHPDIIDIFNMEYDSSDNSRNLLLERLHDRLKDGL